ncbi:hypothetical protein ACP4OV_020026 [Aristida adscensionis]
MKKRRRVKSRQSPDPTSADGSGGEASAADPRGGDEGKQKQQQQQRNDRSPSPGECIAAARAKRHRNFSDPSPVRQGIPSGLPDHGLVGQETAQEDEDEDEEEQQPPHSLTSNRDGDAQAPGGDASAAPSNERDIFLRKGCHDEATLLRDQSALHASHSSTLLGGTHEEASFHAQEESSTCLKAEQQVKSSSSGGSAKIAHDEDEQVSDKIDAHAIEYHKQGEAEWTEQALLALDEETIADMTMYYLFKLEDPKYDDYSEYEPQQQTEVYERLALYRIRAYEAQVDQEPATLEDSNLKRRYPPHVLEDNQYFKRYEKSLEWYFDPERCKRKCFDDYQRLVLRDHILYQDWDRYQSTLNTYKQDQEYLCYCEAVENAIKWVKNHLAPGGPLDCSRVKDVARLQALKIAEGFPSVSDYSSRSAFLELWSIFEFHHIYHDGVDDLYFEIWNRVARQKKDFMTALSEIQTENLSPLRKIDIECALQNKRGILHLKDNYDTYVASIDKKVPAAEARQLIEEAVKKMVPMQETYVDYIKKKVKVAEDIGVIRKDG